MVSDRQTDRQTNERKPIPPTIKAPVGRNNAIDTNGELCIINRNEAHTTECNGMGDVMVPEHEFTMPEHHPDFGEINIKTISPAKKNDYNAMRINVL